jgi:hypothetical protein
MAIPAKSNRWAGLFRPLLNRIWYVHPPVILIVQARPAVCFQTLAVAAKPSTQRLHLRNLFVGGRRYQIEPHDGGFVLTTTSKLVWRYRKRTSSSAVLSASFNAIDDTATRIQMQVRIKLFYLLDVFLIPLYTTFTIIFVPWPRMVIVGLLFTLYVLSWLGHRYNAALEAHEMVYFVQTALEDLVPAQMLSLMGQTPGVVYNKTEFSEQWERFYEEHKGE